MRKLFFICVVSGLLLQTVSCSLNDDSPNFHFKPLQITSAVVPDSFELNETYQITVNYTLPDACTDFGGWDVTKSDTTIRNVVVFGRVRTDQEVCTPLAQEAQASFDFICIYDEPYTFRFWQGEGEDGEQEYFEVIVPVN
jgi:hypothetical protein